MNAVERTVHGACCACCFCAAELVQALIGAFVVAPASRLSVFCRVPDALMPSTREAVANSAGVLGGGGISRRSCCCAGKRCR